MRPGAKSGAYSSSSSDDEMRLGAYSLRGSDSGCFFGFLVFFFFVGAKSGDSSSSSSDDEMRLGAYSLRGSDSGCFFGFLVFFFFDQVGR